MSKITLPGDAPDVKLQKIYAEVMAYENTDFTREHTRVEDKAEGLHETKSTDDIVTTRRGSGEELTMLFIAMARAAGLKAYFMQATSREDEIFNRYRLSMDQLDSPVAIVNVGGKDEFFDPSQRYCAYGHLRWDHTEISGIRQVDNGTDFAQTPIEKYDAAKTVRIANLTLSENGEADGIVQIGMTGDPALYWRQLALRHDETEVENDMEDSVRQVLPASLTVKIEKIWSLNDPSKQLIARFHVNGPLANVTSKRLFVPLEVFEVNERAMFSQPKRETPVYFHYGHQDVDEVHLTYPASDEIESAPKAEELKMGGFAILREGSENKANTIVLTRVFGIGSIIFKNTEYDELKDFYGKVNRKDQEQLVLKVASHAAGN